MEKLFKKHLKELGIKLQIFRKAKGFSQLDLEIASGISRTEISRIENGQKNIELFTIFKLSKALEIEMKELF